MKKKNMPTEKTMDRMEQILKKIEDGRAVTLEELRSAGFILVVDKDFGRVIDRPHLKRLKASLKRYGCIDPVSIFLGAKYLEAYPERELTGFNDGEKKYTGDSPEVPATILIGDGAHRTQAHLELLSEDESYRHPLKFRLVESGLPIDDWIYARNNFGRNWDSKDCSRYIAAQTGYEKSNLTTTVKWQEELKLGEKYAYTILNLSDTYKKKMLSEYMEAPDKGLPTVLKGAEENIDRGGRILHAFRVCWRDIPKMVRNSASINMFIEVYNACGDSMKEAVVNLLVLFFTTLDRTDAESVAGEKDNDGKVRLLKGFWDKFSKDIDDETLKAGYEKKACEAEEEFNAMLEKKEAAVLVFSQVVLLAGGCLEAETLDVRIVLLVGVVEYDGPYFVRVVFLQYAYAVVVVVVQVEVGRIEISAVLYDKDGVLTIREQLDKILEMLTSHMENDKQASQKTQPRQGFISGVWQSIRPDKAINIVRQLWNKIPNGWYKNPYAWAGIGCTNVFFALFALSWVQWHDYRKENWRLRTVADKHKVTTVILNELPPRLAVTIGAYEQLTETVGMDSTLVIFNEQVKAVRKESKKRSK